MNENFFELQCPVVFEIQFGCGSCVLSAGWKRRMAMVSKGLMEIVPDGLDHIFIRKREMLFLGPAGNDSLCNVII